MDHHIASEDAGSNAPNIDPNDPWNKAVFENPPQRTAAFPAYALAPGRWDVNDPALRPANITDTQWYDYCMSWAVHWSREDAGNNAAAKQAVNEVTQEDAEAKLAHKRALNAAAQARWREKQAGGTPPAQRRGRPPSPVVNHPAVIAARAEYDTAMAQRAAMIAQWDVYIAQKREAWIAAKLAATAEL